MLNKPRRVFKPRQKMSGRKSLFDISQISDDTITVELFGDVVASIRRGIFNIKASSYDDETKARLILGHLEVLYNITVRVPGLFNCLASLSPLLDRGLRAHIINSFRILSASSEAGVTLFNIIDSLDESLPENTDGTFWMFMHPYNVVLSFGIPHEVAVCCTYKIEDSGKMLFRYDSTKNPNPVEESVAVAVDDTAETPVAPDTKSEPLKCSIGPVEPIPVRPAMPVQFTARKPNGRSWASVARTSPIGPEMQSSELSETIVEEKSVEGSPPISTRPFSPVKKGKISIVWGDIEAGDGSKSSMSSGVVVEHEVDDRSEINVVS